MSLTTRDIIKTYFETGDRPTQQQFTDWLDSVKWYDEPKVWAASFSANNPTPSVTVVRNDLSGTVVWTRDSAGVYTGTLMGAFPATKTNILNSDGQGASSVRFYRISNDAVRVVSSTLNDNSIIGAGLRIEVYQ